MNEQNEVARMNGTGPSACSVISETMDRIAGKKKHVCDESCKYWRFPHLDTACVLSSVFSVRKGEMCAEYTPNMKVRVSE